ncbi:MAG: hypothetical protein WED11_04615, partial [Natronospirillum sp.]
MWWGKVVGAVLGFYRGGPVGLIMGLILGHWLDRALAQWLGKTSSQKKSRRRPKPVAQHQDLMAAYQVLGVRPEDSDATVKQAYRRAMSQ